MCARTGAQAAQVFSPVGSSRANAALSLSQQASYTIIIIITRHHESHTTTASTTTTSPPVHLKSILQLLAVPSTIHLSRPTVSLSKPDRHSRSIKPFFLLESLITPPTSH